MEFNAIKVRDVKTDHDIVISLAFLQLFTLVSDGKTVMHLVRDSSRGGPGACYDPMDIAATSNAISKEDYEILTDVLFKFKQNPMKFEGRKVLTQEDWRVIIAQPDEDGLTLEAEAAITSQGKEAEIKFRDVHGNIHRAKFAHVTPWTERRGLMPEGWTPEYWIRTTSVSGGFLSRENSIRVPYTEYKRVTDLVLKFRGTASDAQLATNGNVLSEDTGIEFVDENYTKQYGKLGDINVWYTSGVIGTRAGFYVYLGSSTDKMTVDNSIAVNRTEANRLRELVFLLHEQQVRDNSIQ